MPRLFTPHESPPKRRRAVLIAILAVALALVLTCAVALVRSSHQVHRSIVRVQGIGEARMRLATVQRLTIDAESNRRGYLLTGLDSHVAATADLTRNVNEQLDALEESLHMDATAQAYFAELRAASLATHANLHAIVDIASRGGRAASILAAGRATEPMEPFHELVAKLDTHLADEQSTIQARLLRDARSRSRLIFILLAANVVLVSGVIALAWHFVRMRSVAQIVSRSPTIEHEGEWITFETYLDRRFGVKTSRGLTSKEIAKLGWMRTQARTSSGARAHSVCRHSERN